MFGAKTLINTSSKILLFPIPFIVCVYVFKNHRNVKQAAPLFRETVLLLACLIARELLFCTSLTDQSGLSNLF